MSVLCHSAVSTHPAPPAHWSSGCQHATGPVSVICQLPAKHHVHFQDCHLTVSMQPASVSCLSFRCQHTVYTFRRWSSQSQHATSQCQLSVSLLPAKHHVHFQHCHLTVSIDTSLSTASILSLPCWNRPAAPTVGTEKYFPVSTWHQNNI